MELRRKIILPLVPLQGCFPMHKTFCQGQNLEHARVCLTYLHYQSTSLHIGSSSPQEPPVSNFWLWCSSRSILFHICISQQDLHLLCGSDKNVCGTAIISMKAEPCWVLEHLGSGDGVRLVKIQSSRCPF